MSFVFRGSRTNADNGFTGFLPIRHAVRVQTGRPNNSSFIVIVTVILLFMILNFLQIQMSSNFMLWLVLGVFLVATSLRMYATYQQLQAQAQVQAAATGNFIGHTEVRLNVPPSVTLATRGRLQGLRLQLALLDREFDDLDYETLRALDLDNDPSIQSMSEEEINALPVHKYKAPLPHQVGCSSEKKATSLTSNEKGRGDKETVVEADELVCSVCLEQVRTGELLRCLPCMHQFHAGCIDPWLRLQGTCPVCKLRAGLEWPGRTSSPIS